VKRTPFVLTILFVLALGLTMTLTFLLGEKTATAQAVPIPGGERSEISAIVPGGWGGVLYVFLKSGDVYRSIDGGKTWKRTGNVFAAEQN
jgi:hypothetical protein